jgi:hypothetical protein
MDAGVIVAIIIGALILIALLVWAGSRGRERKLEGRRVEAEEHRLEGEVLGARADRQEAEAEERSARARREQAIADEQAALAQREREAANERHEHARDLHPDIDNDGDADRDRETETRRT